MKTVNVKKLINIETIQNDGSVLKTTQPVGKYVLFPALKVSPQILREESKNKSLDLEDLVLSAAVLKKIQAANESETGNALLENAEWKHLVDIVSGFITRIASLDIDVIDYIIELKNLIDTEISAVEKDLRGKKK